MPIPPAAIVIFCLPKELICDMISLDFFEFKWYRALVGMIPLIFLSPAINSLVPVFFENILYKLMLYRLLWCNVLALTVFINVFFKIWVDIIFPHGCLLSYLLISAVVLSIICIPAIVAVCVIGSSAFYKCKLRLIFCASAALTLSLCACFPGR